MKTSHLFGAAFGTLAIACSATPPPLGADAATPGGPAGNTGASGTTGAAGKTGAAGETGFAGTLGLAGTTGLGAATTGYFPPGTAGQTGVAGSPGAAGAGSGVACGSPTRPNGKCAAGAFPRNGVCTCQPDTPCACGDACVDLARDDDNCGGCGLACGPTSTCQNGKCGPAPVRVGPVVTNCGSMSIAVGGGILYAADRVHGTITSFPTATGVVTTIASGELSPTAIAVNGATAFWLDVGTRTIRKSSAGVPVTVASSATEIRGFVVSADGTSVYYSTDTSVMKVPSSGGAGVKVVSEVRGGIPTALAIDGNLLAYPTDVNGDVDIAILGAGVTSCGAVDPTGELLPNPTCLRVARSQGSLFTKRIALRPGQVIWADGTNIKANATNGIQSNDAIAYSEGADVADFVVNGNTIYYAENAPSAVVSRAPIVRDATATRIARGQQNPSSMAVDGARVYWTSDCAIMATGL